MILVNEIFGPTFQGEGRNAGKQVIFIRLAGCNLACIWCDTPYTWNWTGTHFKHPEKFDISLEAHKMTVDQILVALFKYKEVKSVVISGGEPLLQYNALLPLLETLRKMDYYIEIETNGTIFPSETFLNFCDQINCSPKLSTSGPDNTEDIRFKKDVLEKFAQRKNVDFKFVVSDNNDYWEIITMIWQIQIQYENVFLMAEGRTREEQLERQIQVEVFCKKTGINFSPRLQVIQYGNTRGV